MLHVYEMHLYVFENGKRTKVFSPFIFTCILTLQIEFPPIAIQGFTMCINRHRILLLYTVLLALFDDNKQFIIIFFV